MGRIDPPHSFTKMRLIMDGWRGFVGCIKDSLASGHTISVYWRNAWMEIARSLGYAPTSWRNAILQFARYHGAPQAGWRAVIRRVGEILGRPVASGWRDDLRFICEYYAEAPPVPAIRWNDADMWNDAEVWHDYGVI